MARPRVRDSIYDHIPLTLDNIVYDLAYYGESREVESYIVETIVRLPKVVAVFVLDRCRFVSVGITSLGMVLPGRIGTHNLGRRTRDMWIIVLAENMDVKDAHSIVAHEIAHAWLRHDRLGDPGPEVEPDAAKLASEWGFQCLGADVERYEETRDKPTYRIPSLIVRF